MSSEFRVQSSEYKDLIVILRSEATKDLKMRRCEIGSVAS